MINEWNGWTAGIIDGEGSITVVHRKRHKMQYNWESYEVRITVSNTDIKMMQKLKGLWGGSYRVVKRRRIQRKTCYHYCITSKQGFNMLQNILPFLVTKKERAKLAFSLQDRITNHLASKKQRKMTDKEKFIRHRVYLQMKKLNQGRRLK